MLRTNAYVTLISLDFSKAFDSVRHSTLTSKLSHMDIPDNIFNWLVNFLSDRQHATRFAGKISTPRPINASVVQGSGVGPSMYLVEASDLHPLHQENRILKYADDTYLLVGQKMRTTIEEELKHVEHWAEQNNLRLNTGKSSEMLIARRRIELPPDRISNVERVTSMRILGVTLQDNLRTTQHVSELLRGCSRSLYALRILRAHGLSSEALQEVARATSVARLLYSAPAWWGFTLGEDRVRMERMLNRMRRLGFLPATSPNMEELAAGADARLLSNVIRNDNHVLRSLFPPLAKTRYNLRPRHASICATRKGC